MDWNESELKIIESIGPYLEKGDFRKAIDPILHPVSTTSVEFADFSLTKLLILIGYIALGPEAFEIHTEDDPVGSMGLIGKVILEYPPEFGLTNWRRVVLKTSLSELNSESEETARLVLKLAVNGRLEYGHLLKEIIMKAKWLGRVD